MTDFFSPVLFAAMTPAIGCAAILPTIIWTIAMINWMIMGEIEVLFGVPSLLLGIALCYIAIDPPAPIYSPIAFSGIVGMLIVFPLARRQLSKREMIEIDIEQIEKAYEVLEKKADNAVSRFRLAETLYVRGMIGPAIEIGSDSLNGMEKSIFPEEFRTIEKWKRHSRDPNLFKPLPCLECNFYNKPANVHCERCGSRYLANYARGRWLGSALTRKLIASWIIAMIAFVGMPVTLAIEELPTPVVAIVIIAQIGLVGILVWRAFLQKPGAIV